jgi:hypothetical protein
MYVNLTPNSKPLPADPHFLGTLSFFGAGPHPGGGHESHGLYLRFNFPPALLKQIAQKAPSFSVRFVPQNGTRGGAVPNLQQSFITVGRIHSGDAVG